MLNFTCRRVLSQSYLDPKIEGDPAGIEVNKRYYNFNQRFLKEGLVHLCSVILKLTQIKLVLREMWRSHSISEDYWKKLKIAVMFYVEI